MITRMYADILFDREIDQGKHYISPGGYEIMNANGDTLQFDFEVFAGNIDPINKRILHVEQKHLDMAAFPDAKLLDQFLADFKGFTDFFVYTGEYDESEINPVKAYNIVFENQDGDKRIIASEYRFPEQ